MTSTAETKKSHAPRSGYLPTLDGWRALAIIAVMFTHDSLHTFGPFSTKWFYLYGMKGVDVFFAISGILICSRLLDEERSSGRISIKKFYIRRAFRILPAALAYLCVLAILNASGIVQVFRGEWLGSLLFFRNYTRFMDLGANSGAAWFTGHFWSLSVEEHFYFILPALLVLFKTRKSRIIALSFLAILVIANRTIQLKTKPFDLISFHTDIRLDSLLLPAILAVMVHSSGPLRKLILSALRLWPVFLLATIVTIWLNPFHAAGITAIALMMPCVVMGTVMHPHNFLGRLFEAQPIRFVGRISYSLYLWQMLFYTGHIYPGAPLGRLESWPYNFICTFALACLSYYGLELPMIRLGHRFAPSATPGRSDLLEPKSAA